MAHQAKETPVNPMAAATMTAVASVGKVAAMGQTDLEAGEAEEAEPEETDPALDESEWTAELSRRQGAFEDLKQHHKRKTPNRIRRGRPLI